MILSSSILTNYEIGNSIFEEDSKSLDVLKPFFVREECLYDLPLYLIEKYIRNDDIVFTFIQNGVPVT